MVKIKFTKMHGAGNDFILLNTLDQDFLTDLSHLSAQICHRRFGIGADQVLILRPSQIADFQMDIYNADGGRVEMCGNGIRCFAQYLWENHLTKKTELTIETMAGIMNPRLILDHPANKALTMWVEVDMGQPILEGEKIPTQKRGQILKHSLEFKPAQSSTPPQKGVTLTAISMGNPHAVVFVDNVADYPVESVGPIIERHEFFPKRTNVEFVQVMSRDHLLQRTWERGAGETYACGTGACAVLVAAVLNGLANRAAKISLKGGDLDIRWDEKTNHVFKTGPTTLVYEGVIEV